MSEHATSHVRNKTAGQAFPVTPLPPHALTPSPKAKLAATAYYGNLEYRDPADGWQIHKEQEEEQTVTEREPDRSQPFLTRITRLFRSR